MHEPKSIVLTVSIKNMDSSVPSTERTLYVELKGLSDYISFQVRNNRQYFPDRLSHLRVCRGQGCPTGSRIRIPSIPPLQQRDIGIAISGLGYKSWSIDGSQLARVRKTDADRDYVLGNLYASGYYMCPTDGRDRVGSRIRIKADVDTRGDGRPGNNGMLRDVSFGGATFVDRCETTDMSALTSYRPRPR